MTGITEGRFEMQMHCKLCISLLLAGFLLFSPAINAQQEKIVFKRDDKADIIGQMLTREVTRYKKEKLKYDKPPAGDFEIILSLENIESDLVPKLPKVKFTVLTKKEIQKKIESTRIFGGVRYLAFSEFKVEGSRVIVSVTNTYISKRGRTFIHTKSFEYEYQKTEGKWDGKLLKEGEMIT